MSLDLLNLETFKFLMHFRELVSSLYFILYYTYSYIYFFSHTHTYIFSFSLYSFFSLSFFSYSFFICSSWTLNCIVPTSSPMLRHLLDLGQSGDRDKVGNRNIFSFGDLKSSILAPSCDLPWIDDPYSMIGCDQGDKHKQWYFWF
jgi:hypothetical protein